MGNRTDEVYEIVQGHLVRVIRDPALGIEQRWCTVCAFEHPHLRGPQEHQGGQVPVCRYTGLQEPPGMAVGAAVGVQTPWPATSNGGDARPHGILCDIDGTIAERIVPGRGPFDWDQVGEDQPQMDVINLVDSYRIAMGMPLIMLSGRSDACHDLTKSWLNMFISYEALLMRQDGDYRQDSVVKLMIYRRMIEPFVKVVAVFDDRKQVVDMWRAIGLRCYDVAGNTF